MLCKTSSEIELPDDIKKCHFGDSQCVIHTMNDLIRRYPNGISDWFASVECDTAGGYLDFESAQWCCSLVIILLKKLN
ncbi:hypothetical protein AWZ03_006659 [Drosophila navojoa]|uniref:Uncharacterized protein n=1 Tax=Drosophila navojoa TaxID=7232 RepID=A0A484BGN2_DRONA|nr:hypothetical protein AWZ03_006659 [Drosophila navojoa]